MQAKSPVEADARIDLPLLLRADASIRPSKRRCGKKAAAILVWILIWQLAAMGLGHGGLFLATPLQTLGALAQLAPTAAFWQRIVFSALRIMAGFLLAAAGGPASWRSGRTLALGTGVH